MSEFVVIECILVNPNRQLGAAPPEAKTHP